MSTERLIVCPECSQHRRIGDDSCPHCGYSGPPVAALDEPADVALHEEDTQSRVQTIYGPPPFALRDEDSPPAPIYGPPPFALMGADQIQPAEQSESRLGWKGVLLAGAIAAALVTAVLVLFL